jgi:hypothetical protein
MPLQSKSIRLLACTCFAVAAAPLGFCGPSVSEEPAAVSAHAAIPVRVGVDGMFRGGGPYFVKGAGGSGCMEKLAARGANSIRTWTTKGLAEILDQAHQLGLTVSAGIWLENECGWFSYSNPEHCDKQAERVRKEVMAFRDHPALLAWGIGNEVEGDGTHVAFWHQLDRLALLVKELDPAHPTFTSVAGLSPAKADGLNAHAPNLDFVGINTYGGVVSLRRHLDKIGWKRPWMLTEWGPRGFWESKKSASGAPIEQTSTEKSAMILQGYQKAIFPEGGCLGSYLFVWGWKFEATATWFGVFTHEGETTSVADAVQEAWGAGKPVNHAPSIEPMRGVPKSTVVAGQSFEVRAAAADPDGDTLAWHWAVLPEHNNPHSNTRPSMPKAVAGTITGTPGDQVRVNAPRQPGVYRLYAWVKDGNGHVATANMPFEVREP